MCFSACFTAVGDGQLDLTSQLVFRLCATNGERAPAIDNSSYCQLPQTHTPPFRGGTGIHTSQPGQAAEC